MVELHQDYRREDQDGRGDKEKDVTEVKKLLVSGHPLLHHRQRRLVRSGLEQRHGDDLCLFSHSKTNLGTKRI